MRTARPRPAAYLAGPDVFRPDARAIGARKRALCADAGFEALLPSDNEPPAAGAAAGAPDGIRPDLRIYRANLAMLRRADLGLFDLTPFRGDSADAGTVFELGAMVALGRPVFGYSDDPRTLLDRVRARGGCRRAGPGWVDGAGMAVEDFGNPDNLMIAAALAEAGTAMVVAPAAAAAMTGGADPSDGLDAFRRCLREAARILGTAAS